VLRALGDASIFAEAAGEGPVRVVLLHGWRRSSQDYAAVMAQLAGAGVASWALDLPGFGASPAPAEAIGARGYADRVAAALADLPPGPVVVAGHSFGGRVAVALAARHPERVGALVLSGAPLVRRAPARRAPLAYRAVRSLARHGLLSEATLERARRRHGSADYRAATGVMRDVLVALVGESYESELDAIGVPVTLLWGSADTEVPVAVAEAAAARLARGRLEVLEGVGHLVPLEAPEAFARCVLEALA
jgi:pimeloyl-ACP methyl ester carboxylesterase